jgi:hypothetical protein
VPWIIKLKAGIQVHHALNQLGDRILPYLLVLLSEKTTYIYDPF